MATVMNPVDAYIELKRKYVGKRGSFDGVPMTTPAEVMYIGLSFIDSTDPDKRGVPETTLYRRAKQALLDSMPSGKFSLFDLPNILASDEPYRYNKEFWSRLSRYAIDAGAGDLVPFKFDIAKSALKERFVEIGRGDLVGPEYRKAINSAVDKIARAGLGLTELFKWGSIFALVGFGLYVAYQKRG